MGFQAEFSGLPLGADGTVPVDSYSVSEASSPLNTGDTSGGVGTFTLTIPVPDADFLATTNLSTPVTLAGDIGPSILVNRLVSVYDSRAGVTLGTSTSATISEDGGTITVSGESRLGDLNVFGITAQPFSGTLEDAFLYYVGLAGISANVSVDPSVGGRAVRLPGWTGELWYYLKQLASSQDCEITLVSGVIHFRPVRTRVAITGRDTARSGSYGGGTLAQAVEVYMYRTLGFGSNLQAWPPPASVLGESTVEVLNVNAGESTEYTLDTSEFISLTSVVQPTASLTQGSGLYTVVADDGLPVSPSLWAARGGSLSVSVGSDTKSLIVRLRGATNIPTAAGTASANFSIALASDTTGSRYATLNIRGTGILYERTKTRFSTGVPAARTATDVGLTIDNPFITTINELYRAGTRAAKSFSGATPYLSGSVVALNQRGDTGNILRPTYAWVENELKTALGGSPTYGDVQTYILANVGLTYGAVQEEWVTRFRGDDDQLFGNAAGARVWDRRSHRWYRIRDAEIGPTGVTFGRADDDMTFADFQGYFSGLTYGQVQTIRNGLTYADVDAAGLWGV